MPLVYAMYASYYMKEVMVIFRWRIEKGLFQKWSVSIEGMGAYYIREEILPWILS